jgi:phosphate acetyltransferase
MNYIENKLFEEIEVGDTASISHILTPKDIKLFAVASRDISYMDDEYSKSDSFHKVVAHGIWAGTLISTILATQLPGPGMVYLSQRLKFQRAIAVGDRITGIVMVKEKNTDSKIIKLDCICTNQEGKQVIIGQAEVMAAVEKIKHKVIRLPKVELKEPTNRFYENLISMRDGLQPLKTAIVHPTDSNSLGGALTSAKDNLIEPILVGPKLKILNAAQEMGVDISEYQIIDAEHSNAAVEKAIELVKSGQVQAIMKGKIHTQELMQPIVDKVNGLRTGRRISHVIAMSTPAYNKTLFLTDVAINIKPSLTEKRDIVQNAIDLFIALGLGTPKVAIVSAVETVDEKIPSTLDATALCKMSERGQIIGGILDGPLAFDNAVSKEASRVKGIVSQVAGDADIIVVPDIESGNMLYKHMLCFSDVEAAGIVMGARVPIILTSRATGPGLARKASSAMALLYYNRKEMLNSPLGS